MKILRLTNTASIALCILAISASRAHAESFASPTRDAVGEDGYELWLRYRKIQNADRLAFYRKAMPTVCMLLGKSDTRVAILNELNRSLPVMLDCPVAVTDAMPSGNAVVIGTLADLKDIPLLLSTDERSRLGSEGYIVRHVNTAGRDLIVIAGNTVISTLYGTYSLLREMQTDRDISSINASSTPRIQRRVINHWDNLDGVVERGYAGRSLWKWEDLPDKVDSRILDYARACASVGINGTVLNNVNASALSLRRDYLVKTAALADTLRPYGIRVMLSPLFSAPIKLGKLKTADPRDSRVMQWWADKIAEIYQIIPDFGGFVVKANSEGQPGPQTYGATHAEGANMIAKLLSPHGGVISWRAFVYNTEKQGDRASAAYEEFVPNDGKFATNVFIQVKNGPLDFQAREPFHPIFGAMPKTRLGLELQITKEYLGQATHLVYLAPMWKEVLESDTYAKGAGSTVAKVVDGTLDGNTDSLIAGVANTGDDRNWCGHHFDQANWYAYGRLAWDHQLGSEDIAKEWIRSTWSHDPETIAAISQIMMQSRETCVNYMIPLGLNGLFDSTHYGPRPGLVNLTVGRRRDWTTQYFHNMSDNGVGFDRSSTGSNNVSLYRKPLSEQLGDINSCPEKYLLWFHHVPWNHKMKSGRTLWQELEAHYDKGVEDCEAMRAHWKSLENKVDSQRFREVLARIDLQVPHAREWRNTCLDAFGKHALKKR